MGNSQDKKLEECPDPRTGLTHSECNLIRQTWHQFTDGNKDYGMLIFMSFFIKSPQSMELFRHFRGKHIGLLPNEPQFRAHALAVGYQLTSMVENVEDASLLDALIRKNAKAHTTRRGTKPEQFVTLGKTVVEVMKTRDEKHMTLAAVAAWEKLFACMGSITAMVYAEEKARSRSQASKDTETTAEESAEGSGTGTHGAGSRSKVSKRAKSSRASAASPGASSPKVASPEFVSSGAGSPGPYDAEAAGAEILSGGAHGANGGSPKIGASSTTPVAVDAVKTETGGAKSDHPPPKKADHPEPPVGVTADGTTAAPKESGPP